MSITVKVIPWKELTCSRRVCAVVGAAGVLICSVLFGLSLYWPADYIIVLATWLALNLFGFHARYATMMKHAMNFQEDACSQAVFRITAVLCDQAQEIRQTLERDFFIEEFSELGLKIETMIRQQFRVLREARTPLPAQVREKVLTEGLRLRVEMQKWADWKQPFRYQARMKAEPDETMSDIILRIGQFVLWPFLLASAFALRITKVSIEVFGWAENNPTVPQAPTNPAPASA